MISSILGAPMPIPMPVPVHQGGGGEIPFVVSLIAILSIWALLAFFGRMIYDLHTFRDLNRKQEWFLAIIGGPVYMVIFLILKVFIWLMSKMED